MQEMEISPFTAGLKAGAFIVVLLFLIHKTFVLLTPKNKKLQRTIPDIPPAAIIKKEIENKRTHIVVVGGSGMLGTSLTKQLIKNKNISSKYKIRVVDLVPGSIPDVEYKIGSVGDENALTEAFKDADAVYHLAAVLEYNNLPWAYEVNVLGTRHVVNACFRAGVSRLLYTSSISVVFGESNAVKGDERTLKYSTNQLTPYSSTKAIAEIMVLKANGQNGLKTCALRPPVLYGPNDLLIKTLSNPLIPLIHGNVIQAWMHVDNAAHCHIKAMEALSKPSSPVPGNFYFISDGECNALEFARDICKAYGVSAAPRLPWPFAYVLATILEALYLFGGGYFTSNVFTLNRSILEMAHLPFEVTTEKAEKEIGLKPFPLPTFQSAIAAYVSATKEMNEKKKNK